MANTIHYLSSIEYDGFPFLSVNGIDYYWNGAFWDNIEEYEKYNSKFTLILDL